MIKKVLFFLSMTLVFGFLTPNIIGAQTNLTDLGISISVNDTNIQNGDIICSDSNGYKLCKNEYDSSVFGIVNNNPSAAVQINGLQNSQTVISKGEVTVKVSSVNGNIKVGDFLTSSKTPGVAELAKTTGYVIGNALTAYDSSDKNAIGEVQASINIHARTDVNNSNTRENLLDILRSGLSGLGVNPISALRYILASAMVLTSFGIGFIYFGRIAKTGVEAIGRNPLAGVRIEASVVVNILIMLGVLAAGLGIAYLILAL